MIRVRVSREITDYREKIMFGLSIRQLLCAGIAIVLAIGTYLLLRVVFKMSDDIAGYGVILVTLLPLAVGFLRHKGMNFEDYARLYLYYTFGTGTKKYKVDTQVPHITLTERVKESGYDKQEKEEKERSEAVYKRPAFTKKDIKRKWKLAKKEVKGAI